MDLDTIDRRILAVLQADARLSLAEVGTRVGLSTTACWTRIRQLEETGVIKGYTIRIDPAAVGFAETVMVQVLLESHTDEMLAAFGEALAAIPEVTEAFLISGDYDYLIRIPVRDTRDYERLLRERLYRIPGIRHSKSSFVLRKLKETMGPWDVPPLVPHRPRSRRRTRA